MGSYVSVTNDRNDDCDWYIRESNHVGCIVGVVGGLITVGTLGVGTAVAATAGGIIGATAILTDVVVISGVELAVADLALVGALGAASVIGTAVVSRKVGKALKKQGYTRLANGETYRSKKHTLGLLRKMTAIGVPRRGLQDEQVKVIRFDAWTETTDGETRNYNLSQYDYKWKKVDVQKEENIQVTLPLIGIEETAPTQETEETKTADERELCSFCW
eukprot:CAMPEP_0197037684 /NCGR_PEP_ID=MMETSP1384-20130603/14830_1 /TAXON_ID=29189 /ORGANISM="Ammonia sp." /LENGTH=217 /DNA_ID=CAMNT_0042468023 /DNA_START=26 /DNA_END=676 /DNA_ORIENTATION=+